MESEALLRPNLVNNAPRTPLLDVQNFSVSLFSAQYKRYVELLHEFSWVVYPHETLGMAGESGSGKSMMMYAILQLFPEYTPYKTSGSIRFQGADLLKSSKEALRTLRGTKISMIFQEPMNALNPVFTIGKQLIQTIQNHRHLPSKEAVQWVLYWLNLVNLPNPNSLLKRYPHELSGGMLQRVMIAMSLLNTPKLLLADEPSTALDTIHQMEILSLLEQVQQQQSLAMILISHNISVLLHHCHRIAVVYAGQIVEIAPVSALLHHSAHPYTKALLESIPDLANPKKVLQTIPGMVPSPYDQIKGCRFYNRCCDRIARCEESNPSLDQFAEDHWVRCIRKSFGGKQA